MKNKIMGLVLVCIIIMAGTAFASPVAQSSDNKVLKGISISAAPIEAKTSQCSINGKWYSASEGMSIGDYGTFISYEASGTSPYTGRGPAMYTDVMTGEANLYADQVMFIGDWMLPVKKS
jgi:hypothetical protein